MNADKNISIGLFVGEGSSTKGIEGFIKNLSSIKEINITKLTPKDIIDNDLSIFNILVFTGGSGSKQAMSLSEDGLTKVKNYINAGGKYLGICAGAYLATTGFDWSLSIINVETVSQVEWERGKGLVKVTLTDEGRELFPSFPSSFEIEYANGPILKKSNIDSLGNYTVLALYASEISQNGVTAGIMENTPAFLMSSYGKGKVFIIGPHFEYTPDLEHFIPEIISNLVS